MTDSDTLKIAKWMPGLFWLFPFWAARADVSKRVDGYTLCFTLLHAVWSSMQIYFGLWCCGILS